MADAKKSGRWRRFGLKLLGKRRTRAILAGSIARQVAHLPPFAFPINTPAIKSALFIFPPERLAVLHQLKNAAAIMSLLPNARITALAESSTTQIIAVMGASSEVVEYLPEDKQLFTAAFAEFGRLFRGAFDLCCLLAREEDVPLLWLAGRTAAQLRVGYGSAGGFPYLSLRVNPAADRQYLTESNCAMAEILGFCGGAQRTWAVTAETAAEINRLLREARIGSGKPLIGIDARSLAQTFGAQWTEECIAALRSNSALEFYLYAEAPPPDKGTMERLGHFYLPFFSELSISQTAALLKRTEVAVSANSLYFGLATHLETRAVGAFRDNEMALYCPDSPLARGISCDGGKPDSEMIGRMIAAVEALLEKSPLHSRPLY